MWLVFSVVVYGRWQHNFPEISYDIKCPIRFKPAGLKYITEVGAQKVTKIHKGECSKDWRGQQKINTGTGTNKFNKYQEMLQHAVNQQQQCCYSWKETTHVLIESLATSVLVVSMASPCWSIICRSVSLSMPVSYKIIKAHQVFSSQTRQKYTEVCKSL